MTVGGLQPYTLRPKTEVLVQTPFSHLIQGSLTAFRCECVEVSIGCHNAASIELGLRRLVQRRCVVTRLAPQQNGAPVPRRVCGVCVVTRHCVYFRRVTRGEERSVTTMTTTATTTTTTTIVMTTVARGVVAVAAGAAAAAKALLPLVVVAAVVVVEEEAVVGQAAGRKSQLSHPRTRRRSQGRGCRRCVPPLLPWRSSRLCILTRCVSVHRQW
jgi:hypothetical protein